MSPQELDDTEYKSKKTMMLENDPSLIEKIIDGKNSNSKMSRKGTVHGIVAKSDDLES